MFRYGLHTPDGGDVGEAAYALLIYAGEEILFGGGRRFRVLAVVPFDVADRFRAQSALSTASLMSGIESRSSAPRAAARALRRASAYPIPRTLTRLAS